MNPPLCCDCGKPAAPPYTSWADPTPRCERCAVANYKRQHPFTWRGVCRVDMIDAVLAEVKDA